MDKAQKVVKDIRDEAWVALQVSSMGIEGIDELLRDPQARELIETGMCYATAATLAYFKDRGWLNEEAIDAAVLGD